MLIKEIHIAGVGGIESLNLSFDPRMNIICGPNGIGKTTIIECVAHAFSNGKTTVLKRNAKCACSKIEAIIDVDNSEHKSNINFDEFVPSKHATINGLHTLSEKLLSLKINRTFDYTPLPSVNKDTEKAQGSSWCEARQGILLTDVKNWFVNRYLYSPHKTLSDIQMANYELAKNSFSALNKDFSFSRVDAATNEILIDTPSGEIYYEYLSSGFKSCLSVIFGIIKEIEFRFVEPRVKAKDFDGIILIDEIDLHLHPEWQSIIANVLKDIFPKSQFVCTTHSPHIIQSAQPNQIIALESIEGKIVQRDLPISSHGFNGWTIEEILSDVMGMTDLRTSIFNETINKFSRAIDEENYVNACNTFEQLEEMLHPNNHLKKMFRFQLASIKGVEND